MSGYDRWKTTDCDLEEAWCYEHGDESCDCEPTEPDYAQMWADRCER